MTEPTTQNMKVLLEDSAALKRRVEWFERQVFGQKSEKRPVDHSLQHSLLGDAPEPVEPEGEQEQISYTRGKVGKGKLKQSGFWPVYGDQDEIVFTFSRSRGRQHIEKVLKADFKGTLICDGYAAYASYAQKNEGIVHAQCWVHSRRKFIEAENESPDQVKEALSMIATLYRTEDEIEALSLNDEKKQAQRTEKSKPIVDRFFQWCHEQLKIGDLLRINVHPASEVEELTPRLWKDRFSDHPLCSDLSGQ